MNLNVFCFLLLSAIKGTFSAAIPEIVGQLPVVGGTSRSDLGGLLGGGVTGNLLGSAPGVRSALKTVSDLGQAVGNAVAQKSIQNPIEQIGVKSPNLVPGMGNGIGGTPGSDFGGLLGGGVTGNVLGSVPGVRSTLKTVGDIGQAVGHAVKSPNLIPGIGNVFGSLPDLNSAMKTAGSVGQGIEHAVGRKLIETAAEQGLNNLHKFENRVVKTFEDFFGGLFNTGENGGEKGLLPKTAENSLKTIQGIGNGLLGQAENTIERIGGVIGGEIVPKIGGALNFGVRAQS